MQETRIGPVAVYVEHDGSRDERGDIVDPAYHEMRAQGIGGSEAAAALGKSPYVSPWELHYRKRGELPDVDDNEFMYWGRALEPVIAQRWCADHPDAVVTEPRTTWRHGNDDWAFMLASPDRLVGDDGVLEIKTASERVAGHWEADHVPDHYGIQGQWYLEVLDRDWVEFAVLIGGNNYQTRRWERDPALGRLLAQRVGQVWDNIVAGRPPHPSAKDRVADLWPDSTPETVVQITEPTYEALVESDSLARQIKALQERQNEAKNRVRAELGEAEGAEFDGRLVATWKPTKKGTRVLRVNVDG